MTLIQEFAQLMSDRVMDLKYLPTQDGGNVFIDKLPDGPHFEDITTVCASWRGGSAFYPTRLTESAVEIIVRGGKRFDAVGAYTLAAEVRRQLHGWLRARNSSYVGTILKIEVAGPPQTIGYDEKNRAECILLCLVTSDDPVADKGVAI